MMTHEHNSINCTQHMKAAKDQQSVFDLTRFSVKLTAEHMNRLALQLFAPSMAPQSWHPLWVQQHLPVCVCVCVCV